MRPSLLIFAAAAALLASPALADRAPRAERLAAGARHARRQAEAEPAAGLLGDHPPEEAVEGRSLTVRLGVGRDGATSSAVVRTKPFYDPEGERLRA